MAGRVSLITAVSIPILISFNVGALSSVGKPFEGFIHHSRVSVAEANSRNNSYKQQVRDNSHNDSGFVHVVDCLPTGNIFEHESVLTDDAAVESRHYTKSGICQSADSC